MGIAFVLVSLVTDILRPTWLVLNSLKGVVGFALRGLAHLPPFSPKQR